MLALLSTLAANHLAAQPAPTDARRVEVAEFSVTGNTLLQPDAVDAVLARFKGQRSMDELKDAARALQDLYRQSGYGAVVTYLPEQSMSGGKLVIAVLEGRVTQVVVLGNRQFSVANVRRSLPLLQEGQTPQVQRIDAQVQLANDNPARKLALTLEAGAKQGEVDARVNVTEDKARRWTVSTDNTGNAQTGRLRLSLAYQDNALWDLDHQLALQFQFAPEHPGAVRIFGGSYKVPIYGAGLMFSAYGTYSNVDAGTTATAAGALQFNGKGSVLGTALTRVFNRNGEFDQRLTLSLEAREYLNSCAIQGLPAGACGSAGESVSAHPLTLEYSTQRGGDRPASFNVAGSHNLGLGGRYASAAQFDAVRPGATRAYTLFRLGAFAALPIVGDWRLSYRLAAQATGDGLIPGEQFGLAGSTAVRGYAEREITGDAGVLGSVELITPALGSGALRLLAFADAGGARNALGTDCSGGATRCTLASAGLGARFAIGPSQWRVDVARALREGRTTRRDSTRVHFQASLPFP